MAENSQISQRDFFFQSARIKDILHIIQKLKKEKEKVRS